MNTHISMFFGAPYNTHNEPSRLSRNNVESLIFLLPLGEMRLENHRDKYDSSYDVVKIEAIKILLKKFDSLTKHHFTENMNLVRKNTQIFAILEIFKLFHCGPGTYLILIMFRLHKSIVIFRKFQNDVVKTYTFLKSFGRFRSFFFWNAPILIHYFSFVVSFFNLLMLALTNGNVKTFQYIFFAICFFPCC